MARYPQNTYIPGQRLFQCDMCSWVYLMRDMRRQVRQSPEGGFSGFIVCKDCWDPFQGQNLRGTEPPRENYYYPDVRDRAEATPSGYATPTLTSLFPAGPTVADILAVPLLGVTGAGFTARSKVSFRGDLIPTNYGSATSLTGLIPSDFIKAGTWPVKVVNVGPPFGNDGASSAVVNLEIAA